jgi:hypothetical protein
MVESIIRDRSEDDSVYLLEDDYIHKPGSSLALSEGLLLADYVTLYDHPDKYRLAAESGNRFNHQKLHPTILYASPTSHWRETNSTTMTFACRV